MDNHDFDLALLDILLPGTNGLQLCRQLRSLPKTRDLPIIMMTAFYKQADHIRDAREQYGATDYLLKPFPLKTLHEKINALIGAPSRNVGLRASQYRRDALGDGLAADSAQPLQPACNRPAAS